jgi:hypothetical protein
MIPDGVERRLRAHVASVLASAHVPSAERDDVAEELYGHLVERWESLVADGTDPMDAARRAIEGFGSAEHIGRDLTRTYRGRFWASTVGVLLPAVPSSQRQPRIAWWLGVSLRFYAVILAFLSVGVALNISPLIAMLIVAVGIPAVTLLFLAAAALPRRQRWALDLAVVVNVMGLVVGIREMLATPGLISLNVFASGIVLSAAASERRTIEAWVRRSRPVKGALAVAILLVVLGAGFLPAAARELADPTQARPEDLHVELAIDCRPRDVILTADVRWDRISLLPGGLANLRQYGDVLVLDQSTEEVWSLANYPTLVDVSAGRVVAQPDEAYAPNQERTVQALRGPHVIQINWDVLEPNTTYLATWVFEASDNANDPEPLQVAVEYIHADRFRWESLVDCAQGLHQPFVSDWP